MSFPEERANGGGATLRADLASLAVCSTIWGTTWFAITLQLGETPASWSIAYRFGLAAAVLAGWRLLRGGSLRMNRGQHLNALAKGCSPSRWTTPSSTPPSGGCSQA